MESAGAGGECEREVTLQAVVLGEPAPFDLVIVADHSGSLAWSRDELSVGLRDLLTNVQGRSVRIFLLTPTQYGASSAAATIPLSGDAVVAWQDPEASEPYAPAMTDYEQTCTDEGGASIDCPDPKGDVAYQVEGRWSFSMPEPIGELRPEFTAAEFAAEQQKVADAILALGGTGSPEEQPLCTLSRYVSQEASLLPDNAVFLLISDEDDVSLPNDCLTSYKGALSARQQEIGSSPCSSNCDVYRYTMTGQYHWERRPFVCSAYSDTGEPIPGTEMMSWYNSSRKASCDGIDAGPCTDPEKADVQRFCDSGLLVSRCERECATQEGTCQVDLTEDVDACTESFTSNGRTWQNLAAFCAEQGSAWGDCTGQGLHIEYERSFSGSSSRTSLMSGTTTDAIGSYFRSRADAVFGSGQYLVEGILFDPSFSCELGSGQSHAENLARMIADPSHLFPLCESYAPALQGVLDFAQALIQTEFTLSLKKDEQITAIVVIDENGVERTLPASDYAFDVASNQLSIDPSAIRATDVDLRVEVISDCRPVVR